MYEWLGLTVGVVVSATEHVARRPAFDMDVTFITAQELCFTFLRDQTVDNEQRIVRPSLSLAAAHSCLQYLIPGSACNDGLVSCTTGRSLRIRELGLLRVQVVADDETLWS